VSVLEERGKALKMRSVACALLLMMYTSCAAGVTVYEYFTGDGITQVVFITKDFKTADFLNPKPFL
jgi:hypothetical protein